MCWPSCRSLKIEPFGAGVKRSRDREAVIDGKAWMPEWEIGTLSLARGNMCNRGG